MTVRFDVPAAALRALLAAMLLLGSNTVGAQALKVLVSPLPQAQSCADALDRSGVFAEPAKDLFAVAGRVNTGKFLQSDIPSDAVVATTLWHVARALPHRLAIVEEPFVFRDAGHFVSFTRSALLRDIAEDLARTHRVRLLALGYLSQWFLITSRPMQRPTDFSGARIVGAGAGWFTALGAREVPMGIADVPAGAQRGVIDAAILPLSTIARFNLHEVFKYMHTQPSAILVLGFFMSENAWQELAPAARERVGAAVVAAAEACSRAQYEKDAAAYDALRAKGLQKLDPDYSALARAVLGARMAQAASAGWNMNDVKRLEEIR